MPRWWASNCWPIRGLKSLGVRVCAATFFSNSWAKRTGTRKLMSSPSRRFDTLTPATSPATVTLGPPLMPELIGPVNINWS